MYSSLIVSVIQNKYLQLCTKGEIEAVAGGVMDLTKDTVLGERLSQVAGGAGFDHNFCLGQPGVMKNVARYIYCNTTGYFYEL